ncbi:ABC transporter permease [Weissella coleopterorum]|uniref:ABC transporter permease n=1 Tax=Weissella coleopterorum TaxID=2714949 RepID=A0A6G8AZT2_9LACO|nr:ABC transporter permease [Weissella coleopterorum]QIL50472.1 ABC transporter permease [Weissella coleopterorum]
MLLKLSLSGIKKRAHDYVVLFSGLVLTVAIFYMFEAVATNKAFINSSSSISVLPIIFQLGSILLGMITVFYLMYANSFLLTMRQREFGMYIMLGAKKSKVTQIMFGETISVGLVALASGIGIGIGLTGIVSYLLMQMLNFKANNFQVWSSQAFVFTILFFVILFVFGAIFNGLVLGKTKLIDLLKGEKRVKRIKIKNSQRWTLFILAIGLLAIGYYALYQVGAGKMQLNGIVTGLLTIPAGTYLFFVAVVPQIINWLKARPQTISKQLKTFTLGQINFRMGQYARMLAVVTMLLAMALGSLTVGLGFKSNVSIVNDRNYYYDAILHNPTDQERNLIKSNDAQAQMINYQYKVMDEKVYYLDDDLALHMPKMRINGKVLVPKQSDLKAEKLSTNWQMVSNDLYPYFMNDNINMPKTIEVIDQNDFALINQPVQITTTVKTNNFHQYSQLWNKLDQMEIKNNDLNGKNYLSRYRGEHEIGEMAKGLEFMGFFLGSAFLAMMASTLMFKILSGAKDDRRRYQMLTKIGAQKPVMKKAIAQELGWLFAIPAGVGLIHVLFGLQMFKMMMDQPYHQIWIPIMIMGILYFIYYLITVIMYQKLVLNNDLKQ